MQYIAVGHRGYPSVYPENTREGLVAAAELGAPCVELDIQLSKDKVPMVFHDRELKRVCEREGVIWDYCAEELSSFSAHEPRRFGDRYENITISRLEACCHALAKFSVDVFLELKAESIAVLHREAYLNAVLEASQTLGDKRVFISFDEKLVELSHAFGRTGWVLPRYDAEHLAKLSRLNPDVAIVDVKKVPGNAPLPVGRWQWFVYDLVTKEEAEKWFERGAQYIESWNVAALLPNSHCEVRG